MRPRGERQTGVLITCRIKNPDGSFQTGVVRETGQTVVLKKRYTLNEISILEGQGYEVIVDTDTEQKFVMGRDND